MTTITIAEFKAEFARDFTFSATLPDITDNDIQKAMDDANSVFNQDLYPEPSTEYPIDVGKKALLNLTAFFLVNNVDSADNEGQSKFIQTSRSGNGLSESIQIPEWIQGELAIYATNAYGIKFLLISKPYMDGFVSIAYGLTQV